MAIRNTLAVFGTAMISAGLMSGAMAQGTAGTPTDTLVKAITDGKLDFNMNLRYEHVDDDAAAEDADALTLRSTLGYTTGKFHDLSARVLVQDVREFVTDYNDLTGLRSASRAMHAAVADPAYTDLLEAYLAFSGMENTTVKLGRQLITYRGGPFHRHIGTVGWRQNWQNHDAVSIVNKSLTDTTISYAYSWNVNRIFTDKAVVPARQDFDSNSHFINLQYGGFQYGKLEGYAYLMDFDNSLANSLATYGVRFNGSAKASETTSVIYALEYAMQDDYADNPAGVDEDYFQGEIGATFKPGNGIDTLTIKFDYELFTGDGTSSFRTPLATAHAYQGWADRFLVTPADGIQDYYITGIASIMGFNVTIAYHDLNSDNRDYDYGTELDIQVTRALNKHFTAGLKYAGYDGDANANNSGGTATDVSKFWAWLQFSY